MATHKPSKNDSSGSAIAPTLSRPDYSERVQLLHQIRFACWNAGITPNQGLNLLKDQSPSLVSDLCLTCLDIATADLPGAVAFLEKMTPRK